MRIVTISDFVPPDAGYSELIYSKYWAKFGHDVTIITSEPDKVDPGLTAFFDMEHVVERDEAFRQKYGVRIIRIPLYAYMSGRAIYHGSIFKELRRIDPDVVFVNGNDSLIGMQLTRRYPREKYGLVTDSHMLEMASQNRLRKLFRWYYRRFITPKILKYHIPVIRTTEDPYVESALGIPLHVAPVIPMGSDLMLFHEDKEKKAAWRANHGISDETRVVLYAGKLDTAKGAAFLADALREKLSCANQVVFVIVGTPASDIREGIEAVFEQSKNRILRFPTQKYEELAWFYQAADIAIYPKQCSLSFYDVQACGLPVVFEDNSINLERNRYHSAEIFKSGDAQDFRAKIMKMVDMDPDEFDGFRARAQEQIVKYHNYEDNAREYEWYLVEQARIKERYTDK